VFLFLLQRMPDVVVLDNAEDDDDRLPEPPSTLFNGLIRTLYNACTVDAVDTPYLSRKRDQFHYPFLAARNNVDAWAQLSFDERVQHTMLFCASLFTSDPSVEESCFDIDECQIILSTASQHPQFDICHLLYSELLSEHMRAVALSRQIAPCEQTSQERHTVMLQARRNLFQYQIIRLNNMLLTCLLLAMHPAMAIRNYVTHRPPDNEVLAEFPAFACDLQYMAMPTGEPRQINTLDCDIITQFITFVDELHQGSMFASSVSIENLLMADKYVEPRPSQGDPLHTTSTDDDYIGVSVLFSHRPTLTAGMLWLALLVELLPRENVRFMTQYLFTPHAGSRPQMTLVILAHDAIAIELQNGDLIPYTDHRALAIDCAYFLRHGVPQPPTE